MKIQISTLLFSFSRALDSVEHDVLGVTSNHSKRVAALSMQLCSHLGMSAGETLDMATCSILHDNALTEYLLKQGKPSLKTLENIEEHCILGERNVENFPFVGNSRHVVLNHHENWDGSGFFGLKHSEFSDRAAALRLADNIDLLFKMGKYSAEKAEKIMEHVVHEREKLYAPHIVDAFMALASEIFLTNLDDEHIESTLATITPHMLHDVTPEELLAVASIFSSIIDTKSRFTLRHSQGIAKIARIMAQHYGFAEEHEVKFVVAAHLHDVGKLIVPNMLLEKPAALTDDEFIVVKHHAQATHEILSMVRGLEDVAEWASNHHEKLDGSGYPRGLKAEALGFESRLLSCIDIYQALTEDRPYRAGMPHKKAIAILTSLVEQGKMDGDRVDDLNTILAVRLEPFKPIPVAS